MPRLRTVLYGPLFACVVALTASAQSDVLVIKGGTIHAKPQSPPIVADVLVDKGVIKTIGVDLSVPEGATVLDATGKHVFPSMIDAFNSGMIESSSARPGGVGPSDRVLDVYDAFGSDARLALLRQGVGVVGMGFVSVRGPAAPIVSVAASATKPSVILDDAVVAIIAGAAQQGQGMGRASAGGRAGLGKQIEEALDGAKKYRESQEKYEKDLEEWKKKVEEWEKKKGSSESKPQPAAPDTGASPRRPASPPEGFRDWPREKQQEWIRENMRGAGGGARRGGGAESGPTSSAVTGGEKRPDPPEKPKRDPSKEALIRVNKGDAPLWVEAHWVSEIESVLDTVKSRKIRVVIVGATEAPRILDRIKAEKAMVALSDPTAGDPDDLDMLLHRENLASVLSAAGVPIVVTSLGARVNGIAGLPFIVSLHMGRGLSAEAALASVTTNAARALGLGRRLGTVEVGRDAQLLVTTGALLDPATKITSVVAGSKAFDPEGK